ncbi:hypothetical protein G6O67_001056 [Ophiocordyceps sinensis]|uniref:Nucleotide sugar dehydrogenase n=1 Tax=Ophiocordyceps sinensis TaxID=72228 RepID=A0A8H4V8T3_9HYPO|nr:hypothetical protein G6O67_001056 [Ophiocordyceps sinensis]
MADTHPTIQGEAAQPDTDAATSSLETGFFPVTPPADAEHEARDLAASLEPVDAHTRPLVAVIGVGYVGTHLVDVFSRQYSTLGFDVDERRVQDLKPRFGGNRRVALTSCPRRLHAATHFLVSVPTLLLPDKTVDTSYLRSALKTVAAHARPGSTVVIESSVAVGMTRHLLGPVAKMRGFYAGMSPEAPTIESSSANKPRKRVDPGRTEPPAHAIPKVISGLDDVVPGSLAAIQALYTRVFDHTVPVSRPEVAEMTKLYENCQRMMGIAYANEMADAASAHAIDPYEVCRAASTKPFGYMAFLPGVGVGGHCIPVNPYYLLSNSEFPLLAAASEAMARRPAAIAARAIDRLTEGRLRRGDGRKPRALVVGVGFKAGQSTLSNSPGLDLVRHLSLPGSVHVQFADPLVRQEDVPQVPRLADEGWNRETLATFDMIIVTMRQAGLDFGLLDGIEGVDVEWWCV